jgi:hypothetical protein
LTAFDEYDGDYNDMCELFTQATASNDVKLLVSSRPIPSCANAFSSCSTLRLQDLTQGDVTRYVGDKLGQNVLMRRLENAEPGVGSKLRDGIDLKASGIFL